MTVFTNSLIDNKQLKNGIKVHQWKQVKSMQKSNLLNPLKPSVILKERLAKISVLK